MGYFRFRKTFSVLPGVTMAQSSDAKEARAEALRFVLAK
jgi:hypothetical protein